MMLGIILDILFLIFQMKNHQILTALLLNISSQIFINLNLGHHQFIPVLIQFLSLRIFCAQIILHAAARVMILKCPFSS